MSKAKEATTDTTAEVKVPSVAIQSRDLVLALASAVEAEWGEDKGVEPLEVVLSNFVLDTGITEQLLALAEGIRAGQTKGLPLADQVKKAKEDVTAHYATMPIKGGKVDIESPEHVAWETEAKRLINLRDRKITALAAENKPEETPEGQTEQGEAPAE